MRRNESAVTQTLFIMGLGMLFLIFKYVAMVIIGFILIITLINSFKE